MSSPPQQRTADPGAPGPGTLARFASRLFEPVDIASIVLFRIAFGAIMHWEVWRFFLHGWIYSVYIAPGFHFKYTGFGWVRLWPGDGLYWHFAIMGLLSFCIMCGLFYRVATALFFLGFSYVFLLEKAWYFNHFYLICLVSFWMIFIPAHRSFSLDARRRPALRSETAPAWCVWILRFQLAITYFMAGIVKMNRDWFSAVAMRDWLGKNTDFPVLGRFFGEDWMALGFVWGGFLVTVSAAPLLLWKRTRIFAFAIVVCFHLMNARLFSIGIFPWLAIAATTIFFDPDWPRRLPGMRKRLPPDPDARPAPGAAARLRASQVGIAIALGIYVIWQMVFPLRTILYPGDENWTEEGRYFAWHMKVRLKTGAARFIVKSADMPDPEVVYPEQYLTPLQVDKMSYNPDLIHQLAQFIAEVYRRKGHHDVEVRALARASLNERPFQLLIDPAVDLAARPRTIAPADWIVPLKHPLRDGREREGPADDR